MLGKRAKTRAFRTRINLDARKPKCILRVVGSSVVKSSRGRPYRTIYFPWRPQYSYHDWWTLKEQSDESYGFSYLVPSRNFNFSRPRESLDGAVSLRRNVCSRNRKLFTTTITHSVNVCVYEVYYAFKMISFSNLYFLSIR